MLGSSGLAQSFIPVTHHGFIIFMLCVYLYSVAPRPTRDQAPPTPPVLCRLPSPTETNKALEQTGSKQTSAIATSAAPLATRGLFPTSPFG